MRAPSALEELFAWHLKAQRISGWERELRFHPERRWRIDFAWSQLKLAVELEGGTWSGGRHTRGAGHERDCEKYNELALMGWMLLRFTGGMVKSGTAIACVHRALLARTSAA